MNDPCSRLHRVPGAVRPGAGFANIHNELTVAVPLENDEEAAGVVDWGSERGNPGHDVEPPNSCGNAPSVLLAALVVQISLPSDWRRDVRYTSGYRGYTVK